MYSITALVKHCPCLQKQCRPRYPKQMPLSIVRQQEVEKPMHLSVYIYTYRYVCMYYIDISIHQPIYCVRYTTLYYT